LKLWILTPAEHPEDTETEFISLTSWVQKTQTKLVNVPLQKMGNGLSGLSPQTRIRSFQSGCRSSGMPITTGMIA